MADADTTLLRYVAPGDVPHDDGVRWRGRQWLESGSYNPNRKHLEAMQKQYREEKKK